MYSDACRSRTQAAPRSQPPERLVCPPSWIAVQASAQMRLVGHGSRRDDDLHPLVELDHREDVGGRQSLDHELGRGDGVAELLARHRAAPVDDEAEVERLPGHLGNGGRGEADEDGKGGDLADRQTRAFGDDVETHRTACGDWAIWRFGDAGSDIRSLPSRASWQRAVGSRQRTESSAKRSALRIWSESESSIGIGDQDQAPTRR